MCNQDVKRAEEVNPVAASVSPAGGTVRGAGHAPKPAPRAHWLEATIYPAERERVEAIADAKGYEWVSILHDLDVKEGGELKAEHIHMLCHFENARTVTALAKDFQVPAERVVAKDNGQGAMAYLTHNTDKARLEGKHEYPMEALRGPLAEAAISAAEAAKGQADEGRQVMDILDWVDGQRYISTRDVARWAAKEGRWAVFRRAGVIFKAIIEEHNAEYMANHTAKAKTKQTEAIWQALEIKEGRDPMAYKKLQARQTLAALGIEQGVSNEQ